MITMDGIKKQIIEKYHTDIVSHETDDSVSCNKPHSISIVSLLLYLGTPIIS
jgi:hypothetical protein